MSTLLSTVLRQQDGFDRLHHSDWGGTHSTAAAVNAGLDMDMPGSDGYFGGSLQSAVGSGQVSQSTINTAVSEILTEMFAYGLFDKSPTGSPAETGRRTRPDCRPRRPRWPRSGTVLLKNSGNVLPLGLRGPSSIAVIGADAFEQPADPAPGRRQRERQLQAAPWTPFRCRASPHGPRPAAYQ